MISAPQRQSHKTWQRASRIELALLAAYFALIVLLTDTLNIRLGVELMTVVVVAASLISGSATLFLRDWWFLLVGLVLWNLSGPVAHFSPFPVHLKFALEGDRLLFGGRVPAQVLQQHLGSPHVNWLDVVSAFIYNLHVPEPYIAGYFLWRLSRPVYFQFAAAALLLLVLGFISFILWPTIPPWMASSWYHRLPDVTNRFGPVLHAHPLPFHGTPIFYLFRFQGDAVAAFPSEHAAFPLLEVLAFRLVWSRGALLLLFWVGAVLFAITYLGEHWVTDAIAGYAYALVIFFVLRRIATAR